MATLTLTERQREVMRYVFFGKTNEEIGQLLGRSPLTIKNHLRKIMRALGAYNRQNAVYNAISSGQIEVPGHVRESAVCPLVRQSLPERDDDAGWISFRGLLISAKWRLVRCNATDVQLGRRDFDLLLFFLEHPRTLHSRETIINSVWGSDASICERIVDEHVSMLRKKLKPLGYGDLIKTERALGYRVCS